MTKAKSVKTAISLTRETFERAEKLRRAKGLSRSEFYARAIEKTIADVELKEAVERHVAAYKRYPETKEEEAEAAAWARDAMEANPW